MVIWKVTPIYGADTDRSLMNNEIFKILSLNTILSDVKNRFLEEIYPSIFIAGVESHDNVTMELTD